MRVRSLAKAIIVKNDKILLTKVKSNLEEFYELPGGMKEYNETLVEAVVRECIEEKGILVEISDLIFVREVIEETDILDPEIHQIEYYFACNIAKKSLDVKPDCFIPIKDIGNLNIFPEELKDHLINYLVKQPYKVYLSDTY